MDEKLVNNDGRLFIINPRIEFIEDEKGTIGFDEYVGNIYRSNIIGKEIIHAFKAPISISNAIEYLQTVFDGASLSELELFISKLVSETIIIPT